MILSVRTYVCFLSLSMYTGQLYGEIVTVNFTARVTSDLGPVFQMPAGTIGSGWYRFDSNAAPSNGPNSFDGTSTHYRGAISEFTIRFEAFGTAAGSSGEISIGDSIQNVNPNFLSDQFVISSPLNGGISIPGILGTGRSTLAIIFLQDLDLDALSSEVLSPLPPNYTSFTDNPTPRPLPDSATLMIDFDFSTNGTSSLSVDLTSLTLATVPEPSSCICCLAAIAYFPNRRRELHRRQPT